MFSLLEKGCGVEELAELSITVLHLRMTLVSNELMCSKHGFT